MPSEGLTPEREAEIREWTSIDKGFPLELLAELDRVRAERDAALATIAEWEPIMEELSCDLADRVYSEYAGTLHYPSMQEHYDCSMTVVLAARTALGSYRAKKSEGAKS